MKSSRIGIVMSTTREGRFADNPARWILDVASERDDLDFEIVDLRDYPLPFLGETESSAQEGSPDSETSSQWSRKMSELDGYIFVTAEYNHSVTGVLKNSLDHLGSEVHKKPAAFIGYGGVGGARAVEQLRLILIELQMAPTRTAVHIGMEPYLGVSREEKALSEFDFLNRTAHTMLDEIAWWTHALKAGRLTEFGESKEVDETQETRKVDEILEFWFGTVDEPGYGEFREQWFSADPKFDGEIRERFLETHAQARAGKLDHWLEEPRSALALVIVLDQFPRNMFRNSPGMYDVDGKARQVSEIALDSGFDRELPSFQNWFLYMPFLHSEDIGDQRRAMELFGEQKDHESSGADEVNGADGCGPGDWHLKTIERFGRFPHRNEILGRESTTEEIAFLEEQERSKQEAESSLTG